MLTDLVLILDLDNTIFPIRSMDSKLFEPFITDIKEKLATGYSPSVIQNLIEDLWKMPLHLVIGKYNIPERLIREPLNVLNKLDIKLKIAPFRDYVVLQSLKFPKFLVTTGITKLQNTKISALSIRNDFDEIIINDTINDTKNKKELFKELVRKYDLSPERCIVIGDDPDSEIKAGNELNMITVQILREQVKKAVNARYYIKTFDELEAILVEEM